MTADHRICALDQIPRGEGRNFLVAGTRIAIFHNQAGEVFATQAACPHKKGPLADGLLGGDMLICPLHDKTFDLRTGLEAGKDCGLTVFRARIVAGNVVVVTL